MLSTSRALFCAAALVSFGASCAPRTEGGPPPVPPVGHTSGPAPMGGPASGPPGPPPTPAASGGDASAPVEGAEDVDHGPEPQAALPPDVTIGEPKFTSGEVSDVVSSLSKHKGDMAKCVADHGGLEASSGEVEVQFLVRARGRAEGVGINKQKAVSEEASKCIRDLLKNKRVGDPSEDPIGVTVVVELKEASGS